jgi:hypothetical protein
MLGFNRAKAPDIHPQDAFIAELDRVIAAAKARHVGLRTISEVLQKRADTLRVQDAVTYAPRKVHVMNLP